MQRRINPDILKWARERSGLTVQVLASSLKLAEATVLSWELGQLVPSYAVLERLAYSYFKIPVALFYFPTPPEVDNPVSKFRRLPDYETERFSHDTYLKLRLLQAYQESLKELIEPPPVSARLSVNIAPTEGADLASLATAIRERAGVILEAQVSARSAEAAFKLWRHALETFGLYSFKDSFKDNFISGISMFDENFPVVLINNSSSFTRQLFTLLHETAHIVYQVSGVTDESEEYLKYLNDSSRNLEIRCNGLAAEILVPQTAFSADAARVREQGTEVISAIADRYCVSREVILRKLYDLGIVTAEQYESLAAQYAADYRRSYGPRPGGNYYLTKLAYLGQGFAKMVIDYYHQGKLTAAEAGNHLNLNSRNLERLEHYVGW